MEMVWPWNAQYLYWPFQTKIAASFLTRSSGRKRSSNICLKYFFKMAFLPPPWKLRKVWNEQCLGEKRQPCVGCLFFTRFLLVPPANISSTLKPSTVTHSLLSKDPSNFSHRLSTRCLQYLTMLILRYESQTLKTWNHLCPPGGDGQFCCKWPCMFFIQLGQCRATKSVLKSVFTRLSQS